MRNVKKKIPGEPGIWVFIFGDMMVFALFFNVFIYYRGQDPEPYLVGAATLNMAWGAINTLLLLTSSLLVVFAVESMRRGMQEIAPRLIAGAGLCGLGFAVVKVVEYTEKVKEGFTITTNDFYMYYYVLTGVHFLHLIIGLGVLIFMWTVSRKAQLSGGDITAIESGASYWHMVDLLWIVLFPLLYLVK